MDYAQHEKPRILFLDIETRLFEAYTFGIRDQHITHKQIVNAGDGRNIHCVGLKWAGERKVTVWNEWEHGYQGMLEGVHAALSVCDAAATYNGAKFDLPKLNGQFAITGMLPPPPPTQIDIYLAVRKLGFICNKLDYVAPIFGLGHKVKHPGLEMWIDAKSGCPKARRKMITYCAGDVRLTEDLYNAVRPFIANHPHMGMTPALACGSCGSHQVTSQGTRRTKASFIQRLQCQRCGSWQTGKRVSA